MVAAPVVGAVPTLHAEWAAGGLRYRLDVPEGDLGEPLQEEFRHPIDDGTIQALLYGADALLRSGESPTFAREAEARGAVLYRTLVPSRLRDQLKAVAARSSSGRRCTACRGSSCTTRRSSGGCATRSASGS